MPVAPNLELQKGGAMAENQNLRNDLDALDALNQLESLGGGNNTTPSGHTSEPTHTTKVSKKSKKNKHKKEKGNNKWLIVRFLDGDIFKSKFVQKQWGVILLIAIFGILMVSNRYKVERLQKEKIEAEKNINYLNERKVQMQSQSQEMMKLSKIMEKLDPMGIGLVSGPPYEL